MFVLYSPISKPVELAMLAVLMLAEPNELAILLVAHTVFFIFILTNQCSDPPTDSNGQTAIRSMK